MARTKQPTHPSFKSPPRSHTSDSSLSSTYRLGKRPPAPQPNEPKKKQTKNTVPKTASVVRDLPGRFLPIHNAFAAPFGGSEWHMLVAEQVAAEHGNGKFATKEEYELFRTYVTWSQLYLEGTAKRQQEEAIDEMEQEKEEEDSSSSSSSSSYIDSFSD
jgi:hypothetical protein